MAVLRLHHDAGFDLVSRDHPATAVSDQTYAVQTAEGTEERKKIKIDSTYTDIDTPLDGNASPVEILHLLQTIKDRHSDTVTGVEGDDPVLVSKLSALLGVAP